MWFIGLEIRGLTEIFLRTNSNKIYLEQENYLLLGVFYIRSPRTYVQGLRTYVQAARTYVQRP